MLKKKGYSSILGQEIKTETIGLQSKSNNGVIFIEEVDNSGESCFTAINENNKTTYWFNKYLQDLQNRGISKKL